MALWVCTVAFSTTLFSSGGDIAESFGLQNLRYPSSFIIPRWTARTPPASLSCFNAKSPLCNQRWSCHDTGDSNRHRRLGRYPGRQIAEVWRAEARSHNQAGNTAMEGRGSWGSLTGLLLQECTMHNSRCTTILFGGFEGGRGCARVWGRGCWRGYPSF